MNETRGKTISPSESADERITRVENGLVTLAENGQPVIVSAGGGPAFATFLIRYPQNHLTMIVLTNQGKIDHFAIPAVISNELFRGE